MFKGIYKLAGVAIQITSLYDEVQKMCAAYSTDEEPELFVETTPELIDRERTDCDETKELEGLKDYVFPDSYLETLAVYRQVADQLLPQGVLLMHGSVLAVDGEAYMFTAQSGTGKSTHSRLWRQLFGERCVMVNDDKPLIRVTPRVDAEPEVIVYGTPWDGKHRLSTNISVPLKAIVHLQRGKENEIEQISPMEMLPTLLQQTFRPDTTALTLLVLTLLDEMSKKVKFYSLHCNMNPEVAKIAYEGMC